MTRSFAANNKTLNIRLMKAIREKNNADAKSMLKKSTRNSVVCKYGTLLHWAALHGNATITKQLIDLGWNVNTPHDNFTPLMLAVRSKSRLTVNVLLRANANFDRVGSEEFTALESVFFVMNFNTGVARVFLHHLRRRTSTPEECAKKLIDASCSLYHAVHFSDLDLVKSLMAAGRGINTQGYDMKTALHAAVEIGNVELVDWLLNQNADVNVVDNRCLTPVYYAYKLDQQVHEEIERLKILKLLIDRGSDLMSSSVYGYPQLTSVVRYGNAEAIGVLLKNGLDFNAKIESNGKSLLHLLAENDLPGIDEQFQGVNLNVNVLDHRGVCPLYVAARRGNPSMVKFLLNRGADPNVSRRYNPLGATFADELSMSWNDPVDECAYLLLRSGADPQISKNVTEGMFAYAESSEFHYEKIRMVVSHLALVETIGTPIAKYTRFQIGLDFRMKLYYRSCRKILKTKIFESLTLLDLIKKTDDEMKIHLRDKMFIDRMRRVNCKYQLRINFSYYNEILKRRIDRVGCAMRLEYQAIAALNRIFSKFMPVPHLVLRLVIVYLDIPDLKRLCRSIVNRRAAKAVSC